MSASQYAFFLYLLSLCYSAFSSKRYFLYRLNHCVFKKKFHYLVYLFRKSFAFSKNGPISQNWKCLRTSGWPDAGARDSSSNGGGLGLCPPCSFINFNFWSNTYKTVIFNWGMWINISSIVFVFNYIVLHNFVKKRYFKCENHSPKTKLFGF